MKGISPVLATILLVGITVGVIVIVNVWFPSLIGSQQETIETSSDEFTRCAGTTINIEEVRYVAAGTSKVVNVTLSSIGTQDVKNITISIAGGGASVTSQRYYNGSSESLAPGVSFSTSINATSGTAATVPPEVVTASATCQTSFVLSDNCRAGDECMMPV